jgi:hypothetical protein
MMAGTRSIPAEQVRTIGHDYLIVADDVWPEEARAAEQPESDETAAPHVEAKRKPARA